MRNVLAECATGMADGNVRDDHDKPISRSEQLANNVQLLYIFSVLNACSTYLARMHARLLTRNTPFRWIGFGNRQTKENE
jgi:hypothetical protein